MRKKEKKAPEETTGLGGEENGGATDVYFFTLQFQYKVRRI